MITRVMVDTEAATLRAGRADDAEALHALVTSHLDEGRLLPRTLSELRLHATRFTVVERGGRLVGCAELSPLSSDVAEARSLAVDGEARGLGLARRMVDELARRARQEGFVRLCAFAHDPGFFVRLGFSIVPHAWIPEKIAMDCAGCPLFRRCGQEALVLTLDDPLTQPAATMAAEAATRAR